MAPLVKAGMVTNNLFIQNIEHYSAPKIPGPGWGYSSEQEGQDPSPYDLYVPVGGDC